MYGAVHGKWGEEHLNLRISKNRTSLKVVKGKGGQVEIEVPRDRNSEFEPQLVKKNQKRFDGLDEKIISLYSRGLTQNEIKGRLKEARRL